MRRIDILKYVFLTLCLTATSVTLGQSAKCALEFQLKTSTGLKIPTTEILSPDAPINLRRIQIAKTEVKVDSVAETLIVQPPKSWLTFLKGRKLKVLKTEYSVDRESAAGNRYRGYYVKLAPIGINTRGTIILQHGFTRSSRYFHDLALILNSFGYTVIAPDGINVASSLLLSSRDNSGAKLESHPSPVDNAGLILDIINAEGLTKYSLVGHSLGHAVTALVASEPSQKDRIELHVPVNPLIRWLNDFYLESIEQVLPTHHAAQVTKSIQAQPFSGLSPGLILAGLFSDLVDLNQKASLRIASNRTALVQMKAFVQMSLRGRLEHERLPEIESLEGIGVVRILEGLRGTDPGQPGFDTRPLYGVIDKRNSDSAPLVLLDNGFGLKSGPYQFLSIPDSVKQRTVFVYGDKDELVIPEMVKEITDASSVSSQLIPGAGHYFPSEDPFTLARLIHKHLIALREKDLQKSAKTPSGEKLNAPKSPKGFLDRLLGR